MISFSYDTCDMTKRHKWTFSRSESIADSPFKLVHMDLWGPYKHAFVCGAKYFLTILDDHKKNRLGLSAAK